MSSAGIKSILFWENPVHSVSIFVPVAAVLISLSVWSLISVLAWTGLAFLFFSFALKGFVLVMDKLGKPNPLGNPLEPLSQLELKIRPEDVGGVAAHLATRLNTLSSSFKKIILVEDVLETVKFGTLCYTLTYIGCWFNALTLVMLVWILLFTLPKLYLNNQILLDEVYAKVSIQLDAVQEKIFNKPAVQARPPPPAGASADSKQD